MIRTAAWYANFTISLIGTIPALVKAKSLEKKGLLEEREEHIHKVTTRWAKSQVRMSGAKVNVYGSENIPRNGAVLFVSNHQSNFDTAMFMSFVDKPKGYVAKIEMKKVPILRTWMEYMHCIFMERGNMRKAVESIADGIRILKEGHSLVLFPEGTRSRGDRVGEFKAGSFKLATKSKVPIVPVTMDGTYKLMEQNGNRIKPAEVNVYIHPPIDTADLTKEEMDLLPEKVKGIIAQKVPATSDITFV